MGVTLEIKSGKYDLLVSGIFLLISNEPTILTLGAGQEKIKLILKFQTTEKDSLEIKKEAKAIDNTAPWEITQKIFGKLERLKKGSFICATAYSE